jgi:endonuclease/exonuclease/phosphatase family metal-dependent hydrolase
MSRGTGPAGGRSVRALQLNLCNSGIAPCYTGRSVGAAARLIRRWRPDIVTLNEVCRKDVSALRSALSQGARGSAVASAFKAAVSRPADGPFRCRNGQPYGIGVIAVLPSSTSRSRAFGDRYPMQDLTDPEERVWVCIKAEVYACTTHTASTSTAVALAQCRYLMRVALPGLLRRNGEDPVVLGADLNLPSGSSPSAQSCLSDGYQRVDDGSRQDIVASADLRVTRRLVIDMRGTTDHPALLVQLEPHGRPAPLVSTR